MKLRPLSDAQVERTQKILQEARANINEARRALQEIEGRAPESVTTVDVMDVHDALFAAFKSLRWDVRD
jgi:hypothetical protein